MANSGNNQRSGSDTASAANIASGATGGAGQPQSPTLASHTSKPLGGSQTGSGQSSQGPEHLRHQDKDAGKGLGGQKQGQAGGQSGSGSAMDTARQAAQSAGETVRDAAGQVQQRAGELYEQASETAGQVAEQATEWARGAARGAYEQGSRQFENVRRSLPDVRQYGGSVQRFVAENPVLVGVVGLAAGLLLGALLPRTRREDQVFGRWADEVRGQGMRYARDMTQRGREYVDEALGEDDRFASPDGDDWRRDQRSGPSGRFQNH
ncbi:MAG TPA: hypothetical protein VF601_10470 [Beijerinckiaceae bacterium]|jgi:ElaB/YqjD/DUF883 family membrane-anchored ribosome-binding protein